jgi:hypothetical protein
MFSWTWTRSVARSSREPNRKALVLFLLFYLKSEAEFIFRNVVVYSFCNLDYRRFPPKSCFYTLYSTNVRKHRLNPFRCPYHHQQIPSAICAKWNQFSLSHINALQHAPASATTTETPLNAPYNYCSIETICLQNKVNPCEKWRRLYSPLQLLVMVEVQQLKYSK